MCVCLSVVALRSVFIDMILSLFLCWDRFEGASWGNASSTSLISPVCVIMCVYVREKTYMVYTAKTSNFLTYSVLLLEMCPGLCHKMRTLATIVCFSKSPYELKFSRIKKSTDMFS